MKLPFLRLEDVYHLGTLDISQRGANYSESYEGRCLSVSLCPDAWAEIARLGGSPLHRLHRDGALFLDVRSMSRFAKQAIAEWAIEAGHAEMADKWRYRTWDPDAEQYSYSDFDTREEANAQRDEYDERSSVRRTKVMVLTETGAAAAGGRKGQDATDHVLILYAQQVLSERMPDLMGLWWNEQYSPETLSAPRGGILPGRVDRFDAARIDPIEVIDYELLDAMPRPEWVDTDAISTSEPAPSFAR